MAALAAAAVLALSACGNSGEDGSTQAAASADAGDAAAAAPTGTGEGSGEVGKSDIVIAGKSDIKTLDPMGTNDTTSSIAHRHIYSRLIEIDENSEIVGDLAESWEQVSDTEWKFKIHEGVKFHDGTDCTASDVKFSLERAKEMPRVKQYVEQIDSITVEDDHNLTLHLAEPYAPLLAALSHTGTSIVPEAAVTAQGDAFWENPIGTGPMQFVEWVPNDHYSLKRFDDYFKGPGKTTSLTLRIMPEGGARTIALETGEIDMSISVDATDVQNVKANKELMALEKTSVSVEYLAMNCEKEPFNDPKVRQAINYAINKEALAKVAFSGYAFPSEGPLPQGVDYAVKLGPWPYNPKKAKELLAEAGYPNGFETTLWSAYNHTTGQKVIQFIQQQLAQVGIKAQVQALEAGQRVEKVESHQDAATAPVRLYYTGWSSSTGEADWGLRPLFAGDKTPPSMYNISYYKNPTVDADIMKALGTTDRAEKTKLYTEVQEEIWKDAPWAFLVTEKLLYATSKKLTGMYVMPDANYFFEEIDLQ